VSRAKQLLVEHPARSLSYHMLRYAELFSSNVARTLAMLSLFAVPFGATGLWVSYARGTKVFSRSVTLAFLWLVLAPFLIRAAFHALARFLDDIKPRMSDSDHDSFQKTGLSMILSGRHSVASLPLGLAFGSAMFFYSISQDLPLEHVVWNASMFTVLGLVAGTGFWGVQMIPRMIDELSKYDLRIDVGHPDRFGGLKPVGDILVVTCALFFTGSLLVPLAMELLATADVPHINLLTIAALGCFVLIGLSAFFAGILKAHRIISKHKIRIDQESGARLETLIEENLFRDDRKVADVLKPLVYYYSHHAQLGEMKQYPYDTRTVLQLCASVLIPVVVFAIDKLLR